MNHTRFLLIALTPVGLAGAQDVVRTQAGARNWQLVENLRIGGDDDGPKSFTAIRDIAVTKNGNIFVLETKVQEVRVFDPTGRFLKLAARKGQGPAEIDDANGLAVGGGDVVWVHDPGNGRFTLLRPDGTLLRDFALPINSYGWQWGAAIDAQGRAIDQILVPGKTIDPVRQRPMSDPFVRRLTPEGKTVDTLPFPSCSELAPSKPTYFRFENENSSMNMGIPFLPRTQTVVARTGTVWCTPAGSYTLLTATLGSPLKEVVKLPVTPLPVPADERKKFMDGVANTAKKYVRTIGDPDMIPKVKPVISSLFTDDRGRAWVVRTMGPDSVKTIDVFEPGGRPAGMIRTKAKIGAVVVVVGNSLYTTVLDADDVPMLVRYAIVEAR